MSPLHTLLGLRGQKYCRLFQKGDQPEGVSLVELGQLMEMETEEEKKESQNLLKAIFSHTNSIVGFTLVALAGLAIWFIGGSWSYGLLVIGLAFAVGVGIVVYNDGNKVEKDRILVTYLSFLIIIIFWSLQICKN